MIVKNASVFGPDGSFYNRDVYIENGVFSGVPPAEGDTIDATNCFAVPGLIDIHFHGALNYDVCDASYEAYEKIASYEASQGVTAICPATLTLPVERLEKTLQVGSIFSKSPHRGADLIGFNMEGPFISVEKKGAQNEAYIKRCDTNLVERFIEESGGLLKIVGLAPEVNPGFENYIEKLKDKVIVSLAHTNSDYDTAVRAFRAGARHVVHLYNAMTEFSHREPGVVGAVFDCSWVNAEIITDGIHNHPSAVRAAFNLNGAERMVLVSDSLCCVGMPDGEYRLGGQPIIKNGNYCRLKESGRLAGAVTNLTDCMRTAVRMMGIPLETAIRCATINPAKAIQVDRDYGSIEPGKKGHLVLLRKDEALSLAGVIMYGRRIV